MPLQSNGGRRGNSVRLGIVIVALCAAMTAGCAGKKDKELKYVETPVDELYNKALDALSVKRFQEAAKRFDEVERQHPYSVWARRAMLMSAYSYYRSNKYDDAILAAKRFITLHPGNRDVAYAYYLIGVSYYEQISDVGRDQKMTEEALKSLREVVRRFPNSDYARDARVKVDMTLDHLAGKEMTVGRWYLRRNQPLAAINRFTNVVRDYQTTTHVPEALLRLTEAYLTMGVYNEAKATAAVLGYNFPGSKWYENAFKLLKDKDLQPDGSGDIRTVEAEKKKQPAARPDPRAAAAPAPAPSFDHSEESEAAGSEAGNGPADGRAEAQTETMTAPGRDGEG
jgi:outer membrane protein assembly factor BamD